MAEKIAAGKYHAKVVDYTLRKTQAGEVEPLVRFAWKDEGGSEHEWNWRSSLKEKARENTLKSLIICGFAGTERDFAKLANGVSSGLLDLEKEVQIIVSMETGKDGKIYPKIDWVNQIGGQAFRDIMTEAEAVQKLTGMNLAADLMKLRQEMGVKMKVAGPPAAPEVDIPF